MQLLHSPPPPTLKRPAGSGHLQMQVQPQSTSIPWVGVLRGLRFTPLCPLPQETSQPLNLTAKPKGSDLPSASSSPSLKMSGCQSLTPSHGATRDLQTSPSNLPLGRFPGAFTDGWSHALPWPPPRGRGRLCPLGSLLPGVAWVGTCCSVPPPWGTQL